MTFLKISTFIFLAGCSAIIIFASTHPHDASGTWISDGSMIPRAQTMAGDGDSFISVWYQSEILVGYLGETDKGVLGPVPLERALRVKTPDYDGFKKDIYVKSSVNNKKGYTYIGLLVDGTSDMHSRLVLGMQTSSHIPASRLDTLCGVMEECPENATYASSIWHINRATREMIPAYSADRRETDLGVVFEEGWTGELNLALKDVSSETRLIFVPAQDRSHRTL